MFVRKFKVITTCAALVLMVAIMAFGVYAAVNSVSISVSGTISFKCTDVYIKVTYGIVGDSTKTYGPYFSQPGEAISWKDEGGNAVTFDTTNNTFANKLPDMVFTETGDSTMPTCTYFITVENLHGMDIGLSLGYKWTNNDATKNTNPITAKNKVVLGINETDKVLKETQDNSAGIIYLKDQFVENTTRTLFVTLTLDNEDYIAGGTLQMALAAAVNVSEVPAINF